MATFLGDSLKTVIFKSIEAFGKGASTLAEGAQQKLNEMSLDLRRRELTGAIPAKVLELWRAGADMPEELSSLLAEMDDLEQQLSALRAARAKAAEQPAEEAEEAAAEEEAEETEQAPEQEEGECESVSAVEPVEESEE